MRLREEDMMDNRTRRELRSGIILLVLVMVGLLANVGLG